MLRSSDDDLRQVPAKDENGKPNSREQNPRDNPYRNANYRVAHLLPSPLQDEFSCAHADGLAGVEAQMQYLFRGGLEAGAFELIAELDGGDAALGSLQDGISVSYRPFEVVGRHMYGVPTCRLIFGRGSKHHLLLGVEQVHLGYLLDLLVRVEEEALEDGYGGLAGLYLAEAASEKRSFIRTVPTAPIKARLVLYFVQQNANGIVTWLQASDLGQSVNLTYPRADLSTVYDWLLDTHHAVTNLPIEVAHSVTCAWEWVPAASGEQTAGDLPTPWEEVWRGRWELVAACSDWMLVRPAFAARPEATLQRHSIFAPSASELGMPGSPPETAKERGPGECSVRWV